MEIIARVRYHSKGYIHLLEKQRVEKALKDELDQAARYVKDLLPKKLEDPALEADFLFIPSSDLAGDSFGYYWLDEEHLAIYLLDVCGHGVGSALHSISVLNFLKTKGVSGVDLHAPVSVLEKLNSTFQMSEYNNMFFTIWYGVYSKTKKQLSYTSGGHPPAVLLSGTSYKELHTEGVAIGVLKDAVYEASTVEIESGDKLYVFSDGVYEIERADIDKMLSLGEFIEALSKQPHSGKPKLEAIASWVRQLQGHDCFEDDFSLLEICFK